MSYTLNLQAVKCQLYLNETTILVNSLGVKWLGLSAFTAVAQVQSLVGELRSHKPHSTAKKKKKSNSLKIVDKEFE